MTTGHSFLRAGRAEHKPLKQVLNKQSGKEAVWLFLFRWLCLLLSRAVLFLCLIYLCNVRWDSPFARLLILSNTDGEWASNRFEDNRLEMVDIRYTPVLPRSSTFSEE